MSSSSYMLTSNCTTRPDSRPSYPFSMPSNTPTHLKDENHSPSQTTNSRFHPYAGVPPLGRSSSGLNQPQSTASQRFLQPIAVVGVPSSTTSCPPPSEPEFWVYPNGETYISYPDQNKWSGPFFAQYKDDSTTLPPPSSSHDVSHTPLPDTSYSGPWLWNNRVPSMPYHNARCVANQDQDKAFHIRPLELTKAWPQNRASGPYPSKPIDDAPSVSPRYEDVNICTNEYKGIVATYIRHIAPISDTGVVGGRTSSRRGAQDSSLPLAITPFPPTNHPNTSDSGLMPTQSTTVDTTNAAPNLPDLAGSWITPRSLTMREVAWWVAAQGSGSDIGYPCLLIDCPHVAERM